MACSRSPRSGPGPGRGAFSHSGLQVGSLPPRANEALRGQKVAHPTGCVGSYLSQREGIDTSDGDQKVQVVPFLASEVASWKLHL